MIEESLDKKAKRCKFCGVTTIVKRQVVAFKKKKYINIGILELKKRCHL